MIQSYNIYRGITKKRAWLASLGLMLLAVTVLIMSSLTPLLPTSAAAQEQWQIDGFAQISATGTSTCGLTRTSAQIWCWGFNNSGEFGNNTTTPSLAPVRIDNTSAALTGKHISYITTGFTNACVVADGTPYCWGANSWGQLGDGTTTASLVPVAVDVTGALAGKTVTAMGSASNMSCALADGEVFCWGANSWGQLGDGTTTASLVPVAVSTLTNVTQIAVSPGGYNACAVSQGRVSCWGMVQGTELGNYSPTPYDVSAVGDAQLEGKTVTSISIGGPSTATACAVADGKAYCWGDSANLGLLGNGVNSPRDYPTAVATSGVLAGKTVTQIEVGSYTVCAIADSKAYCWGLRGQQLGNNSDNTQQSLVPVAVSGAGQQNTTAVTVGESHACLLTNGIAYCWGYNGYGAMGVNDDSALEPYMRIPVLVQSSTLSIQDNDYRVKTGNQGRNITLKGASFKQGATVKIGITTVVPQSISHNSIALTAPASTTEKDVTITVTNPDNETATLVGGLTYYMVAPTITETLPTKLNTGVSNGQVTIAGVNFSAGAVVLFDGVEMTPLSISEYSNIITVMYPYSATEKTISITVRNANGTSATLPNVSYVKAEISDVVVHPESNGSIVLEVQGQNFNSSIMDAISRSLVTLNGDPLGFCTTADVTPDVLGSINVDPMYYSENPPCYMLFSDANSAVFDLHQDNYTIKVPADFDVDNFFITLDSVPLPYTRGTPQVGSATFITNVPTGFMVTDTAGTNLTVTGTTAPQSTVILRTNSGIPIAEIAVDTSSSHDWSSVTAGIDTETGRAFVHGLVAAPGAISPTFTLYVPKKSSDNVVVICPGAANLDSLELGCPNAVTYTVGDPNVAVALGAGFQEYWKISGLTGTGGVSLVLSASQYFAITGRQLPAGVPGNPSTGFAALQSILATKGKTNPAEVADSRTKIYLGATIAAAGSFMGLYVIYHRRKTFSK